MMKIQSILSFTLILIAVTVMAQPGKDGPKTVNTANQIYNEYTTLTADANIGAVSLQVAASSLNANARFGGPLATGDLILIIQMQGATIDGGEWWVGFGAIGNYNTCGANELLMVESVPNATTINVSCALTKNYMAAGRVQVVRVPRFTLLTVNSGGSISCDAWNGAVGGVLALEVSGVTTINAGGTISASGKGFRGGTNSDMNSVTGSTIYASVSNIDGAEKGEGIAGQWADYDLVGGRYCRNAAANGGGGGNGHNGGGGGGGNGSRIFSYNGNGIPDTSQAGWILAWDAEAPNFHHNQSDGGGRGGYTFSWNDLDATVVGPNDVSWGGDYRRNVGGQGGRALDYNFGKLFMGGGGGAGDQGPNTNYGGNGGRGGGLIYVVTYGNVNGAGQVISNGDAGTDAQGTAPFAEHGGIDGAGGGGAGGTIVVLTTGTIANSISLTANGGDGGDQVKTKNIFASNNGEAEGPGGGGGGGHIAITNGSPIRIANGGVNGISYAQSAADCGVTEFPPNGATKGGYGSISSLLTTFGFTTINDTVCEGESAMLIASLFGTVPSGTVMNWYDSPMGGNLIGSGDTLVIAGIAATVTVYAGTCPGWYRNAATIFVNATAFNGGSDAFLCNGSTDTLNASGGTSYSWSPLAGLSNPAINNPEVNTAATTQYTVTILDAQGCSGVDTVMVFVNNVNSVISNDTSICAGGAASLIASGGLSYLWSTGDTTAGIVVSPLSDQSYTVTISAGSCSDTASVDVTMLAEPTVFLGNDTAFCAGGNLPLNAGNPGASYIWQDNTTSQTLIATTSGNYIVTVTNPSGCSATDQISVAVIPNADASITAVSPVCENIAAFVLTAAQGGGVWQGTGITDSTSGLFDPEVSGAGFHLVTYTIAGMCGEMDQSTVEVMAVPIATIVSGLESCKGMQDAWIDLSLIGGTKPYDILWSSSDTTEDLSLLAPGVYTVTVADSNNCVIMANEEIMATALDCYTPHIYIPNVFSPNGDGVNDVLYVRGAGVTSLRLLIYDRWGEKVFETTDLNSGWDGSLREGECENGVYFYTFKATLDNDNAVQTKGNITLVR